MIISINQAEPQSVLTVWNQGFSDYMTPIEMDQSAFEERIRSLGLSKQLSGVAAEGDRYTGVILLGTETFEEEKLMWIGGMAVPPDFRRQQWASRMIEYAKKTAKQAGVSRLTLEVLEKNEAGKRLYEKQGFCKTAELAVGFLPLNQLIVKENEFSFRNFSMEEWHEPKQTPWQNRSCFAEKRYQILQGEDCVGYVIFKIIQENGDQVLDVKQLSVIEKVDAETLAEILGVLKSQETGEYFKFVNFDMGLPEYSLLEELGFQLKLKQLQLEMMM